MQKAVKSKKHKKIPASLTTAEQIPSNREKLKQTEVKSKKRKKNPASITTAEQISSNGEKLKQTEVKSKKRKKIHASITTTEQISSNWEKLKQELPPPKKKKKLHLPHEKQNNQPKTQEIWFDDVDEVLLEKEDYCKDEDMETNQVKDPKYDATKALVKTKAFKGPTRLIAMDCEMVGVGASGKESILGRASIVNHFGQCIYDKFVKPTEPVTDYRTEVSGLRPEDLEKGEDFKVVQKEVSELLKGRILIGHALHNDLKVLFLDHPRSALRDTAKYKPFRKIFGGKTPSLKRLTETVLGVKVQEGEHNSIQDAQAAMRLYTMNLKKWEESEQIGRIKLRKKDKLKKKKVNSV